MKTKLELSSAFLRPRYVAAIAACAAGIFALLAFTQSKTTAAASSSAGSLPRFFIYQAPQGVADDAGEPSIGSNWTKDAENHNTNVDGSVNTIHNGGTTLYFGGFL